MKFMSVFLTISIRGNAWLNIEVEHRKQEIPKNRADNAFKTGEREREIEKEREKRNQTNGWWGGNW